MLSIREGNMGRKGLKQEIQLKKKAAPQAPPFLTI